MSRITTFALVSTAAAVLSGCSGQLVMPAVLPSDQPCHGLGCACEKPSDCDSQYECAGGHCELAMCSPYRLDGGCPAGRVCSSGVCVAPARAPYCDCTPTQGCDDGQCTDITATNGCSATLASGLCPMGSVCELGTCVVLGPDTSCSVASPHGLCPQGTGCVDGVCIPIADEPCGPARLDGLCDAGLTCVSPGVCDIAPCGPTAPLGRCDPGMYCSSATNCRPYGTCDTAQDCGSCRRCDAGTCVDNSDCAADADCCAGTFCSAAGTCLPVGHCSATADCSADQYCSSSGTCIALGTCETSADCTSPAICKGSHHCLGPNECAMTPPDCPAGFDCTSGTCTPGGQLCDANAPTAAECPAGSTCCPQGERCSAGGSCIFDGQCVTDVDCLAPYFVCGSDYRCAPTMPCSGCTADQKCSAAGGCIPASQCDVDVDCPADQVCNALFQCVPTDNTCGSSTFGTTLVKPNMLIVLDKSGSMGYTFGTTTRWAAAKSAITSVLDSNSDRIRFGLTTFPGSSASCAAGSVNVAVGEGTASAILDALNATSPGGNTPTPATLRGIAGSPGSFGLPDPTDPVVRGNYALLVTDGQANCLGRNSSPDPSGANGAVDLVFRAGITTYVIGIAFNTVSADLNCNAVWGRTSRCGGSMSFGTCSGSGSTYTCTCSPSSYTASACYYEAGDAAALTAAFDQIAKAVASCSFVLSTTPPDPTKLYVFLKDNTTSVETAVSPGATDGWTYDPGTNQLRLNGASCTPITNGTASPVVKYGCVQGA